MNEVLDVAIIGAGVSGVYCGWRLLDTGVRSWDVEKAVIQPVADVPVYICGEAYSSAQGWVEGALDTADQLLARAFRLTPPSGAA